MFSKSTVVALWPGHGGRNVGGPLSRHVAGTGLAYDYRLVAAPRQRANAGPGVVPVADGRKEQHD